MGNNVLVVGLSIFLLLGVVASAPSANSPAKIVSGFMASHVSSLIKWLWSLKATPKTGFENRNGGKTWFIGFSSPMISGRPMVKYETGYTVETVFDGSKLGIEPYSVEVLPKGELLILDSANSNIYKTSSSLSLYSRPRLVAGSPEGYSGYIDGKPREARLNNPKGLTVDDRGNIYVADTVNKAIRKISDGGVTTIAGGKSGRGGSHIDGPSEDAKFSDDFDVVYIGSSCSLLVIDRGKKAIREIQLHFDDCAYQYESGFPLGIAVLLAAVFFGYMLALLQQRVGTILSSHNDQGTLETSNMESSYQKPVKSVRLPLIPTEHELGKQEDGFFSSLGNLFVDAWASVLEILRGKFPRLTKKPIVFEQPPKQSNSLWPVQESYVVPDEDEPPPIETRNPTPRKTYAFMSKDAEKMQQLRQSGAFYGEWDAGLSQQHQWQQQLKQQHHRRYYSSIPYTYYEQRFENTNEIVFGAVQEQDVKRDASVIKPLDYGNPMYNHYNLRSRTQSVVYPRRY